MHSGTTISPFFANYGYHPHFSFSLDTSTPSPEAHDFSKPLSELHDYVRQELAVAQAQYQIPADQQQTLALEYNIGNKVWLLVKNITTKHPSKNLDHCQLGPFVITERISSHAYCLGLP